MSRQLDAVRQFISETVHMTDAQTDALTLAIAQTHAVGGIFSARPHILVTSGPAGTGKSTVGKLAQYLALNGKQVADATIPSIRLAFKSGPVTPVYDDIGVVFGYDGVKGSTSAMRGLILRAYDSETSTSEQSRGGAPDTVNTFGTFVMSGRGLAVSDDIRQRSIVIRMVMMSGAHKLRDLGLDDNKIVAKALGKNLGAWIRKNSPALRSVAMSDLSHLDAKMFGRTQQVWKPLFAVAHAAGPEWFERCMTAYRELELSEPRDTPMEPSDALLIAALAVYKRITEEYGQTPEDMAAETIRAEFRAMEHGRYSGMSDVAIGKLMRAATGIGSHTWRDGETVYRGWHADDFLDIATEVFDRLNKTEPEDPISAYVNADNDDW